MYDKRVGDRKKKGEGEGGGHAVVWAALGGAPAAAPASNPQPPAAASLHGGTVAAVQLPTLRYSLFEFSLPLPEAATCPCLSPPSQPFLFTSFSTLFPSPLSTDPWPNHHQRLPQLPLAAAVLITAAATSTSPLIFFALFFITDFVIRIAENCVKYVVCFDWVWLPAERGRASWIDDDGEKDETALNLRREEERRVRRGRGRLNLRREEERRVRRGRGRGVGVLR
ncbi:uncharacterized protein DS421_18g631020 [Arachis hypogaea]|nr:uncharacterized protein DS421_18g631020 [Arachis hypogaea]